MRLVATCLLSVAGLWAQARMMERVDLSKELPFQQGRKVAVLVGVGTYPRYSKVGKLDYPGADVQALHEQLEKAMGYTVISLKDGEATSEAVRGALRDAATLLREGKGAGTILFYFSGHGWVPKARPGKNYLATYDASAEALERSGLAVEEVLALLATSGAERRMLFIDACRNVAGEPGQKGNEAARTMEALERAKGTRVFRSSREREYSYEDPALQHGVFSFYLLQGLQGKAAGSDGMVTFSDLVAYVRREVEQHTLKMQKVQIPVESATDADGDFLLARVTPPARVGPVLADWCGEAWNEIREVADLGILESFVADYAECREQVRIAQLRLRRLEAAALPAGAPKRFESADGLRYVFVPAGAFRMGCSAGDPWCSEAERPGREVRISKGFWMGESEVTQRAYQAITGKNPSYFEGADLPVENVSWTEASAYCGKIGGRLPTEAEWEYAARGGVRPIWYGDVDQVAWHEKNSDGKTHPVKQKQANAYGLNDMLGNVWEWTADWFTEELGMESAVDPKGPPIGELRALRGGSLSGQFPWIIRASFRGRNYPDHRNFDVGFRCVANP